MNIVNSKFNGTLHDNAQKRLLPVMSDKRWFQNYWRPHN